jgi:hypothetical protein
MIGSLSNLYNILSKSGIVSSKSGSVSSISGHISSIIKWISHLYFSPIVLLFILFFLNLFQAHAIGIRGEKQGLRVEIIRIVLQTLTFTSGT